MKGYSNLLCARCGTYTQHQILEPRHKWKCLNCDHVRTKTPRRAAKDTAPEREHNSGHRASGISYTGRYNFYRSLRARNLPRPVRQMRR
jgi:hypothetical protein